MENVVIIKKAVTEFVINQKLIWKKLKKNNLKTIFFLKIFFFYFLLKYSLQLKIISEKTFK